MNYNFHYKYYNQPTYYSIKSGAAELLRHLCNAVENPTKNQKVRPARKLTALSCGVTPWHHLTLVSLTCLRYHRPVWVANRPLVGASRRVFPGGKIRRGGRGGDYRVT